MCVAIAVAVAAAVAVEVVVVAAAAVVMVRVRLVVVVEALMVQASRIPRQSRAAGGRGAARLRIGRPASIDQGALLSGGQMRHGARGCVRVIRLRLWAGVSS